MNRRIAKIPVVINVLEAILPAGSVIHGFNTSNTYRVVDVIVEHPSFDEVEIGECIPTRSLTIWRCPNYKEHKVQYATC